MEVGAGAKPSFLVSHCWLSSQSRTFPDSRHASQVSGWLGSLLPQDKLSEQHQLLSLVLAPLQRDIISGTMLVLESSEAQGQ